MASRFLRKYKLSSSINSRVQDFELNHPINKFIKPTQVYLDNEVTLDSRHSQFRTVSQETRIPSSIILKPIPRPPRHTSLFAGESGFEPLSEVQIRPEFFPDYKSLPRKFETSHKKDQLKSFRIRSPRHFHLPNS